MLGNCRSRLEEWLARILKRHGVDLGAGVA
jgi:hypothetical protein